MNKNVFDILKEFPKNSSLIISSSFEDAVTIKEYGFSYSFSARDVNSDKLNLKHANLTHIVMIDSNRYNIHWLEFGWKVKNLKSLSVRKFKALGRPLGSKNKKTYKYNDGLTHIVLFSGGLGSYFTAKRLLENGVNRDDIILLYTDTKIEDADLYRFMKDAEKSLKITITEKSDGRDIWQVFKDRKYLGNSRVDPCSQDLKRKMSREFISEYNPKNCIIYLGYDWTEIHRFEKAQKAWLPYILKSPLCEEPYISKPEMTALLELDGIELPRLYKMGFSHNNCGGGCVKAGIGHFTMLYENLPNVFKMWEDNEQEIRNHIGKEVSMLRRTRNGVRKNFTLKELREEIETITPEERCEIGGCGCFSGDEDMFEHNT